MTETRQTVDDLLAASRSSLDRLEPAAAEAEVRAGAILVDTRCREQLQSDGAIPGAIHVPLSVLYWRADPASGHDDPRLSAGYPDQRVILVCAHGYSSSIAAATLRQLGFSRATDVIGGFERWKAEGLPVETTN
jgi:rhodanese-related sulfurtransferase